VHCSAHQLGSNKGKRFVNDACRYGRRCQGSTTLPEDLPKNTHFSRMELTSDFQRNSCGACMLAEDSGSHLQEATFLTVSSHRLWREEVKLHHFNPPGLKHLLKVLASASLCHYYGGRCCYIPQVCILLQPHHSLNQHCLACWMSATSGAQVWGAKHICSQEAGKRFPPSIQMTVVMHANLWEVKCSGHDNSSGCMTPFSPCSQPRVVSPHLQRSHQ
jgi:hypothetical protein